MRSCFLLYFSVAVVWSLIQANMDGQIRRQSWDPWPSSGGIAAPFTNDLPNASISVVNFTSESKPFSIYEPGTRIIPYGGALNTMAGNLVLRAGFCIKACPQRSRMGAE